MIIVLSRIAVIISSSEILTLTNFRRKSCLMLNAVKVLQYKKMKKNAH